MTSKLDEELERCPFCGKGLVLSSGKMNKVGRCLTEDCWMAERKIVVPLTDPRQVQQWNTRTGQLVPAQPSEDVVEAVAVPRGVIAFLKGRAPLKGVWFGERHPTEPGAYWWRKYLPNPESLGEKP